ncbi:MAG: inorganic pyrophosphatase [Anaerolineae bacterium]
MNELFWYNLDQLIAASEIVLDRPAGSVHPRHTDIIYPLDYGYLAGTSAGDGDGIDVWLGSLPERALVGIVCTADVLKRDTEIKLLLGCTCEEIALIQTFLNHFGLGCLIVPRSA